MNTNKITLKYVIRILTKKKIFFFGKSRIHGRNNSGIVVTYHRGGGHKKLYRFIDLTK
jgi:ribosomal protein L2